MGVPKLTQDIAPFAEPVTLSRVQQWQGMRYVDKVVIDGPSLVYYVFYQLCNGHYALDPSSSGAKHRSHGLPSYAEVDAAVVRFLERLRDHGVVVLRIFFDGGLPVTKQRTRLGRLQRSRIQLESYRLLNPAAPFRGAWTSSLQNHDSDTESPSASAWSNPANKLPVPPFIVPSVVEQLMLSPIWREVTEVVDDESDPYCACLAAQTGAAVLSNDSDLVVYDLGDEGSVVHLESVELVDDEEVGQVLKGSCYRPGVVATGLDVVSLREFAYQRSMDGQATSRRISQKTRSFQSASKLENLAYKRFIEDYTHSVSRTNTESIPQQISILDPRTAELVFALQSNLSLRVYLSILHEDPSRDSSWLYGRELRQSLYSVLLHYSKGWNNLSLHDHVIEAARSGRTIKETRIAILPLQQTVVRLRGFLEGLEICESSPLQQQPSFLRYFVFAARLLENRKSYDARSCMKQIYCLMSMNGEAHFRPSWDDVHILANIHAIFYSLRMTKQIFKHASQHLSQHPFLHDIVQKILQRLADMPAIQDLFFDALGTWHKFQDVPFEMRSFACHAIESASQHESTRNTLEISSVRDRSSSTNVVSSTTAAMQASKKRNNRTAETLADRPPISASKRKAATRNDSNNPYSLLGQD